MKLLLIITGSVAVYVKKTATSEPIAKEVLVARGTKERARFGEEVATLKADRAFGELAIICSAGSLVKSKCNVNEHPYTKSMHFYTLITYSYYYIFLYSEIKAFSSLKFYASNQGHSMGHKKRP